MDEGFLFARPYGVLRNCCDLMYSGDMDTKKKTVYIETTIPSYATARTSEDVIKSARQVMTNLFWEKERQKYNLYISQYVIDECAKGDTSAAQKRLEFIKGIPLLPSSDKIDALAVVYQNILNIPEKSKVDSFHLAISVIEEMDYVLSQFQNRLFWNWLL